MRSHVDACIQLLKGLPVALPREGQLPDERPQPRPPLERHLRFTVRLLCFQVCWSLVFLFVPLALRGNFLGTALRLPQLVSWACTILLVPRLSYFLLALAWLTLGGTLLLEALYVVLGFTDFDTAWDSSTQQQFWLAVGLHLS